MLCMFSWLEIWSKRGKMRFCLSCCSFIFWSSLLKNFGCNDTRLILLNCYFYCDIPMFSTLQWFPIAFSITSGLIHLLFRAPASLPNLIKDIILLTIFLIFPNVFRLAYFRLNLALFLDSLITISLFSILPNSSSDL